ncbi:MAG: flagellar protein FlgN [Clostridium sp.]|nr:flagellar protein FlgN [Clostridium sp.]
MTSSYLDILEDSLKKKKAVLESIEECNQAQSELLKGEKLDMEGFDALVDRKDAYIEELEKLDEGFETVYEQIKADLSQNKGAYAEQIKRLQALISQVTEKSVSIQAQESRNRDLVGAHFKKERETLGQGRRSSKAALSYYQNLNKAVREDSSIVDMKK